MSLERNVLVVRAAPGEKIWIDFRPSLDDPSKLRLSDAALADLHAEAG